MASYDDLRNVIKHITEVTGDDSAWKKGLTDQQVRDVNGWLVADGSGYKGFTDKETGVHYEDRSGYNTDKNPAVPDADLDRIRNQHPGLFDPETKAPTTPQPAVQQGNAGGNNGDAPPAGAPVQTEEQNKGEAAKAAKTLEDKLQDRNNKATDADRELAQAVLNAHATTAEGAKRLNDIQSEITAAVNSATALDTPMGAREFSKFLNSKLAEISDVVKTASLDAESQKSVLSALAEFYGTRTTDNANNGEQGKGDDQKGQGDGQGGGQGGAGGDGGGAGGGDLGGDLGGLGDPLLDGAGGGDPLSKLAESAAPALQSGLGAASQIPSQIAGIPAQLAGMGSSIPGMFGGNGNGRGGELTDPFKTDKKAGGEGDPFDPAADAELAGLFGNEPLPGEGDNGDNNDGDNKDDDKKDDKDDKGEPKPGEPVNNPNAPGVLSNPNGPTPVTIDGMIYTADNPKLAAAVTDISKGTPPLEAFRKHDIALPPPTSPPATPLGPDQLRFGSYGTYSNGDIVVVLDKQRAIIDGEVQPISSAASKPGFLGWQDPPAPTASPEGV